MVDINCNLYTYINEKIVTENNKNEITKRSKIIAIIVIQ